MYVIEVLINLMSRLYDNHILKDIQWDFLRLERIIYDI